ncbi:enolase C-terminal domain-like protein [Curtobacterium sp. 458]|uniref:enolase C-terminal domain-like protein n=1 Tax=Curtobacterium sp. 458 TaxID=3050069 RepID=UPI0025B30FE3|nr:enolase C-terminal domain-like protein [Curtobacterium sp. 458]WJX98639.1 enolase C-terminal domain-like protein [Curtobacterium sp. 458]
MSRITGLRVRDVRFPTSREHDGSDAMNPAPDYSAAYVELSTDEPDGHVGTGFVFTIGRGNEVQEAAIAALREHVVGSDAEALLADMGATWRDLVHDSQLRWLGPEKGVMHMAIGAVVNALWDLKAKRAGQPLWALLADMTPEELVALVDFRYLTDAITPDEALALLRRAEPLRAERKGRLEREGYPAYTTTPGWLGYDDDKLARLCREAVDEGFEQVKLKVGADVDEDVRRMRIAREVVGPDIRIAIDANQRWDVDEAVAWIERLRPFDVAWVEEPTSPDDVLAHAAIARRIAPIPVATGEHMANRVIAKQLIQAGAMSVLQIDATRVAGVNENLAILLLAAKYGVRVCPHAGGVGLCEAVQHLSMFDAVALTGDLDTRCIEFVDHLHEHFVTPVDVHDGRYWPPSAPGAGTEMLAGSLDTYTYPDGPVWAAEAPAPPVRDAARVA